MIAGNFIMYNLQGPNIAAVTVCTTGNGNIGLWARMIAAGDVDAMLVGGAEMARPRLVLRVAAARACLRNDDPESASRPGLDRDGFVLGDGAGMLMLELREAALGQTFTAS